MEEIIEIDDQFLEFSSDIELDSVYSSFTEEDLIEAQNKILDRGDQ